MEALVLICLYVFLDALINCIVLTISLVAVLDSAQYVQYQASGVAMLEAIEMVHTLYCSRVNAQHYG